MQKLNSLKSFQESENSITLKSKEMATIKGGVSTRTHYGELTCIRNVEDRMVREDTDEPTKYTGWRTGIWYASTNSLHINP